VRPGTSLQIALVQARHVVAATGTSSWQYGHVFISGVGAAVSARMKVFESRQTTKATITNEMTELMNAP